MTVHSFINILLLLYLISFPIMLQVNIRKLRGKNKSLNKALKYGRKIHPYVGIALILSGALHGFNKMGSIFITHTGSLLLLGLLLTGMVGFIFRSKRDRFLAKVHVGMGIVILGLFLLHYLNPWFL
jgi:hypothetical protein